MADFDLPDVESFTAGTVGPAGQRTFFLQARAGSRLVTLQLEKLQVATLAEYLAEMLRDLPAPAAVDAPTDMSLVPPIEPEWVVGQIGVAFDEGRDRIVVQADELTIEDDTDDDPSPGMVRVALTRAQVQAFVVHATVLVSAGRPTCPLCGRPIDPEGHMCIKTNGHKKH